MSLTTSSRSLDFRGFSDLLSHCISHVEKSVQRMNLNNIRLRLFGFCLAEDNIQVELRPRILPALRPEAVGSSGCHKPETKKFRSVSSEDCLFPDQSCHGWPTFTLMKSIAELSASAVTSGAALYPGCTNSENCPTVILCSQNEFWTDHNVAEIAKVVDYFYHITRVEIQSKGIALLINAKNVGDCIAVVSAVICSFEVCVQKALRAVYFVVDSATNDHLVLDSFKLPSQVVAKVVAFENYDAVFEVFDRSQIPVEAGGSMIFCLEKWVEYRSLLEKFIRDCFVAANNLLTTTEDMMQTVDLPRSVRETEMALTQHDEKIKKKLEDELFQKLSTAGKSSLQSILDIEQGFRNCRDLCDSAETAEELFQKLQSSADRLQFLADKRRQKLDGCLQLRRFEEEASQIVNRLCTEGEDLLQKFGSSGDNLRSTKLQLQEFNKSYSHFKDLVTKGKEVIEEVSLFTQLGICDELTGIKEICRELKSCTASYMTRMDVVKEILENTHNCYVLLDQSFEWALKTMKFVVDMKLEKEMNLSEVERSKSQLEDFMKEHPPFPLDVFTRMESLLPSLNNRRLTEQWLKAKGHYIEINALIKQRYETLIKVLNQSKSETRECAEAKSMTFLADTGTARTPLMTAASKISNEPKSQNDAGCCSHLSSGPTTWNKPVVSSATTPGAECNTLDSSVHPESICLRLVEHLGDSQVDLDVFIPCSASQYGSIKCNSFDEVIPRLSQFEAADNTDPVGQYSSLANFSHSSNVVNYRSHSTGGISPTKTSRDTRPASFAFDVSEYMLKDDLSEANLKISDTNPCFNQNSLPESNRELVSHKPPSGVAYSSQKSLQSNFRSASLDKRHASLLSSSTTSVRNNTKPSWKSFRKVLNGFTDRDSNLKKHFFRRNSADSSANVVCADSTESLPGRLQDEDATVEPSCLLSDEDSRHQRHGWSNTPSNSHMIFSNRLALASHSQSVNDICIGNDETQKSRVLSLILRELVMTESDYIKSLKYVITNYIPELLSDNIVRPLHGKKNLIFGNIEKIYEFHSLIFLAKLQRCQNSPFQLGACFLQHESEFFLYALYNKNKPKADVLMEEFGTKYFQKKQRELNDRMDLNSYLLKPVQRMGKYALLLRQILKECPETHADFSDLKAALEMVKFQLRHGNDLLAMDCLRDCDVNLQEQGVLLRQNEFLVFHGRKKCLRQVFLFEEIIVFSKTKRCSSGQDLYLYKNSIKTSELGLTESVGESGCRFEVWFRKRTPGMTYVMQSHSSDVKQQWVDDISQLLWKQTFRNRERRMAEMACMGIGSKPSLDLKQSKDNINDRFVNICSSDRTRAMRPKSVSFSPCYDSQRPHSMISVSSVSLSGSSFSSGYGSCLSSGYGAITGALLTTTKESPLEYIELSCEEAVSEATLCNAEVKDSGLECITTLASSNSMDDSHTMDLSASNSNDSGFIERGCMAAEERSRAKPEGTGLFGLMKEDAYTQTTLERPHKTLAMKGTAPIVSVESDCDDFY